MPKVFSGLKMPKTLVARRCPKFQWPEDAQNISGLKVLKILVA
jgi:hypothetical protein